MSLESRFDPPTPQEELKPATTCTYCGEDLYYGDEVYLFWDFASGAPDVFCDQCGPAEILELYAPQHRDTLKEDHI